MTTPISPENVTKIKSLNEDQICVVKILNKMIVENWNGRKAVISQDDLVEKICRETELPRQSIFQKHLLDIEDIFREKGWLVEYYKPPYYETASPTFTFWMEN